MRLLFAAEATNAIGLETAVVFWDAAVGSWLPVPIDRICSPDPQPADARGAGKLGALKRNIFPSTLWESARHAARALPPAGRLHVVLHTSYLAPLVRPLRTKGMAVSVDVYDVIWRVHEVDSRGAGFPKRPLRHLYSSTVRPRELRGLRSADHVLSAGWADKLDLEADLGQPATWAPTGLEVPYVQPSSSDLLRVGLIGNFEHSATIAAATELLASPLAEDHGVQIVFAGRGSEAWNRARNVVTLGLVDSVTDFYSAIDVTAMPVTNPSGMKTKLAESALAGRPVLTTPQGAAGYHPDLRDHFVVFDRSQELTGARIRQALSGSTPARVRSAFEAHLGPLAARDAYLGGLSLS